MKTHQPADPSWWRRVKEGPNQGDYEQQEGRYRLAAMTDSGGRTAGWVLYVKGRPREQRRTLLEAKKYAYKVTQCPCDLRATDGNHTRSCAAKRA